MSTKLLNDEQLVRQIRRIDTSNRSAVKQQYDLAIDYLEGRQEDDVRRELTLRFPSSQEGDAGQGIFPVTIPLTDRYVSEAANAYNKPVTREIVGESGEPDEALTEQYTDALAAAKYDEFRHRNEQIGTLLGVGIEWTQAKRGNLRPVTVMPQDCYPLAPEESDFVDLADPEDQLGYAIELHGGAADVTSSKMDRPYAFVSHDETVFYEGPEPNKPNRILTRWPNPYTWRQVVDEANPETGMRSSAGVDAPGLMLTFWHTRLPLGSVIPVTDADIVNANRELNILWSIIFDDIRFQGHSIPVLKLTNPSDPKARRKHGSRFPIVLNIEEGFEYHNAGVAYDQQVSVLRGYAKAMAQAKRMSPNDFSLDQQAAISGFAKLVDSLPKIEAREEKLRRLRYMEEQIVSKRNIAVLIQQGRLDARAAGMQVRVTFAPVEFPKSPDEQAKIWETEIKLNLTTPAQILAARDGTTEEEAQAAIDANAEANKSKQPPPEQQPQQQPGGVLGGLFGNRVRQQKGSLAQPQDDN